MKKLLILLLITFQTMAQDFICQSLYEEKIEQIQRRHERLEDPVEDVLTFVSMISAAGGGVYGAPMLMSIGAGSGLAFLAGAAGGFLAVVGTGVGIYHLTNRLPRLQKAYDLLLLDDQTVKMALNKINKKRIRNNLPLITQEELIDEIYKLRETNTPCAFGKVRSFKKVVKVLYEQINNQATLDTGRQLPEELVNETADDEPSDNEPGDKEPHDHDHHGDEHN